jgi:mevalonate kinase
MYPSKILLFGEYSILLNSDALVIPYDRFKGELTFKDAADTGNNAYQIKSNLGLMRFFTFSVQTKINEKLEFTLDLESFEKDIENGLYFNSDIPEESGLGSSGALVAAVFDKYSNIPLHGTDIQKIRNCLALMESFFHGNSSGIDPLASYLKSPLLLKKNEINIQSAQLTEKLLREYGFFIGSAGQSSKTSELVKKFNLRCKSDSVYLNKICQEYIPVNNECIMALSEPNNAESFFSSIRKLSLIQTEVFNEMIPLTLIPIINFGHENNLFYLKLCGSGGGGYFLGFTGNIRETSSYFNKMGYNIMLY